LLLSYNSKFILNYKFIDVFVIYDYLYFLIILYSFLKIGDFIYKNILNDYTLMLYVTVIYNRCLWIVNNNYYHNLLYLYIIYLFCLYICLFNYYSFSLLFLFFFILFFVNKLFINNIFILTHFIHFIYFIFISLFLYKYIDYSFLIAFDLQNKLIVENSINSIFFYKTHLTDNTINFYNIENYYCFNNNLNNIYLKNKLLLFDLKQLNNYYISFFEDKLYYKSVHNFTNFNNKILLDSNSGGSIINIFSNFKKDYYIISLKSNSSIIFEQKFNLNLIIISILILFLAVLKIIYIKKLYYK
jgi:hypothetical protein